MATGNQMSRMHSIEEIELASLLGQKAVKWNYIELGDETHVIKVPLNCIVTSMIPSEIVILGGDIDWRANWYSDEIILYDVLQKRVRAAAKAEIGITPVGSRPI